jgi:acetyltransferase EpsM
VRDVVLACGDAVAGFVDRRDATTLGHAEPVLSEPTLLNALPHGRLPLSASALALGIGDNGSRLRVFTSVPAVWWATLVHPTAVVGSHVVIGEGTVLMPNVVVNASARLGRAVIVNTGAIVEHDCVIGDAVHVAPGAVVCGRAEIGDGVLIGAGATVLPGVAVGAESTVGAASVVVSPVAAGSTVIGQPARVLSPHR